MRLRGTPIRLLWKVPAFNLAQQSAPATLARIAQGELGKSILCWVPLMNDGGDPAVAQEWVRLARGETDRERRAEYAGLALVFAERAGCLPVWQQALKEWDVEQSQLIAGWRSKARDEGRLEAKRDAMLKVLRRHFPPEVPADLTQIIQQQTDLDALERWFDAALTALSLEAFRAQLQPPASP